MKTRRSGLFALVGIVLLGILSLLFVSDGGAQAAPLPIPPPLNCPHCADQFCQGHLLCVLTSCTETDCNYACAIDLFACGGW